MNEEKTRGRDLLLYIDKKRLKGVTSFLIKKNIARSELKEYLCEKSYAHISDERYIITLTVFSSLGTVKKEPFILSVLEGEDRTRYEDCVILEETTRITPDGFSETTYIIESNKKRKGGCSCGK